MRKILIGVGALLVLLVVAATVVPMMVPTEIYKQKVIAAVKSATGRDLTIDGPVKLGLLTGLSLQAKTVSLSNVPGGIEKEMLTLTELDIGLKLMPLLDGDVEISHLNLKQPVIHLEIDKAGHGNWSFTPVQTTAVTAPPEAKKAAPAKNAEGSAAPAQLKQLGFGDVRITDGTITYADARSGAKQVASKIDMKITLENLDHPLGLDGSLTWRDQPVTIKLSAETPRALILGQPCEVTFALDAKPLKVDLKGKASTAPQAAFDGTVSVSSPSVRSLAAWVGSPLSMQGSGFGPFSLDSRLAVSGTRVSLASTKISLDALKITGDLAIDTASGKPSLKGQVAVDALDLDPYLPAPAPANAEAATAPGAPPAASTGNGQWSDAPINLAPLKAANADLSLSTGSIKLHKIEIGKTALTLALNNGRLGIDMKQFSLYGGYGIGHLTLDGSGAAPAMDATLQLDKVQMKPLLVAAMNMDRLDGTGSVQFSLSGHGASQRAMIGTLGGKGAFYLANGVVQGLDVTAMLRNVASALASKGGNTTAASGHTDFSVLKGTFVAANGIMTNNDLDLESPLVKVAGTGTIDLPQRTVNYRINPLIAPAQGQAAGGIAVPVFVQGPWNNLSYRPDLTAILSQKIDPKALLKNAKGNLPGLLGVQPQTSNGQPGNATKPADVLRGFFQH